MAATASPVFHFELRRLLNEVQEDATVLEQPALGYFKVHPEHRRPTSAGQPCTGRAGACIRLSGHARCAWH